MVSSETPSQDAPYVELHIRRIIWRAFLFGVKAEVADLAL
jgi:hypothetical protein